MWDYAYKNYPEQIDFLAQNGYLEILQHSYIENQLVALFEMSAFSKMYNLEKVGEAPLITYAVKHAFVRSAAILKELRAESAVTSIGPKVILSRRIDTAIVKHHQLKNFVDSVMRDLDLPENHIMRIYVDGNIAQLFKELNVEGQNAIFQYEIHMQTLGLPSLSKVELEDIKIMLYNGSAIESVMDESVELKYIDSFNKVTGLQIGQYSNQKGSTNLDKNADKNQKFLYYQDQTTETLQNFSFNDKLDIRYAGSSSSDELGVGIEAISKIAKSIKENPETELDDAKQDQSSPISTNNKFNSDQPETEAEIEADDAKQNQSADASKVDKTSTESNPEQDQPDNSVPADDGAPADGDVPADDGAPADGGAPADVNVPADGVGLRCPLLIKKLCFFILCLAKQGSKATGLCK
jgi:hypothetical protein